MREYKYLVQTKGFSGWANISLLKLRERYALTRECNFKMKQTGKEITAEASMDNVEAMEKLIERASNSVKDLEVKHIKSGKVLKSFDDMEYDADFEQVVQELAFSLLNGVKLGEG